MGIEIRRFNINANKTQTQMELADGVELTLEQLRELETIAKRLDELKVDSVIIVRK